MTFLIAQELNSGGSRFVAEAIRRRDAAAIAAVAHRQIGADYLDVNAAAWGEAAEPDTLCWLVEAVQKAVDVPLSLDSVNAAALRAALPLCRRPPLLNCFSAAASEDVLSLAGENPDLLMIAVCYDGRTTKTGVSERLEIVGGLVERFRKHGRQDASLILDPVTLPADCGEEALEVTCETMRRLRQTFPDAGVLAVPGNYSYGRVRRREAERRYATQALEAGARAFLGNALNPLLLACLNQ